MGRGAIDAYALGMNHRVGEKCDVQSGRKSVGRAVLESRVLVAVAFALVAFLAAYNLEHNPRTWYDEGVHTVAARTLAQSGQYGLPAPDGTHLFDPFIGTGPTVIVPVALAFKTFGIGLLQGRLVMVIYLLLAAAGLYVVGRQLYGRIPAIIALMVFASLTDNGPFENGRWVLGEVPAVAFVLWATCLLVWARTPGRSPLYVASGALFGLSILTKPQFVLLVPALIIVWLARRWFGHRYSVRQPSLVILGMAIPVGGWYLYQVMTLGLSEFLRYYLSELPAQASVNSYAALLRYTMASLQFVFSSGFATWGIAGLVYVLLVVGGHARRARFEDLFLPVFTLVWLAWYATMSVGWPRYTVPAALVSCLFVGKLFGDILAKYVLAADREEARSKGWVSHDALPVGLASILVLQILSGVAVNTHGLLRTGDDSPQRFAAMVERDVEPRANVESVEWEIDFLTGQSHHHPPKAVELDGIAKATRARATPAIDTYEVPPATQYIIDGPFSKQTGMYRRELASGNFQLVGTVGGYDLYRRRQGT